MKTKTPAEWKYGEKLGRAFVRGLRGGDAYADALEALDKARQYPGAFSYGMFGFCQGAAQEIWRRQRRTRKGVAHG
jgi:hypothetical protein